MRKTINQTHVEGYLYEHKLQLRVAGENSKNPGTQFIMGTIDIATDEALTNIVQVHYTYVTPTTKSGPSQNFIILSNVINGVYITVMGSGKEEAVKLRIDSAIGLNEFYSNRTGAEELVSVKRNEGGFIHVITDALNPNENERNTFKVDMVITNVFHTEADPEHNIEERATIKGCVFDFRNAILPVEFTATNPGAIDYYESLEASPNHPVFTRLWGRQISQTITRTYSEESSWGEDDVRTVVSNRKDWVITGGAKETYTFGGPDDDISTEEMKKAMGDRQIYIAGIKSRQEAYQNSRVNAAPAAPAAGAAAAGGFNF